MDGPAPEPDVAGRLLVRAPNHLGELVLALPALERAALGERAGGRPAPLVQVVAWLRPLIDLALPGLEVLPLERRRAVRDGAGAVRRAAGGSRLRAVTLTPSFSSALLLRLAGVASLRGTAGGGRTFLLTDPVDRAPLLRGHRVNEFLAVCGFRSNDPPPPPRFEPGGVEAAVEAWRRADLSAPIRRAGEEGRPILGIFPGANGPARRWPADRYAELARRLADRGAAVLVLGGPGETALTAEVAGGAGDGAFDLGGRTSLPELAGALRSCDLLVTNDTGPMHLAAAVGCAVLALEGPADLRQTRPLGRRVRVVGRFDLPCVPCVKNACPRRGAGYVLPDARRECMRLIEVVEVEEAVNEMLSQEPA